MYRDNNPEIKKTVNYVQLYIFYLSCKTFLTVPDKHKHCHKTRTRVRNINDNIFQFGIAGVENCYDIKIPILNRS